MVAMNISGQKTTQLLLHLIEMVVMAKVISWATGLPQDPVQNLGYKPYKQVT